MLAIFLLHANICLGKFTIFFESIQRLTYRENQTKCDSCNCSILVYGSKTIIIMIIQITSQKE